VRRGRGARKRGEVAGIDHLHACRECAKHACCTYISYRLPAYERVKSKKESMLAIDVLKQGRENIGGV
jgi:hypothetical protein